MEYKGYVASVSYDDSCDLLHGRVVNSGGTIVSFAAPDLTEFKREFKLCIDEYLLCCKEYGDKPQKPYSGKIDVQLGTSLHKTVTIVALEDEMTVTDWLEWAIRQKLYSKWAEKWASQTRKEGATA